MWVRKLGCAAALGLHGARRRRRFRDRDAHDRRGHGCAAYARTGDREALERFAQRLRDRARESALVKEIEAAREAAARVERELRIEPAGEHRH